MAWFFYLHRSLSSEIIIYQTHDFSTIEECIQDLPTDALVLFDIDDTLIVPVDEILKPINEKLFDQLTDHVRDRDVWLDIHLQAPQIPVDKRSFPLIAQLQQKGIATIAFTAVKGKIPHYELPCDWRIIQLLQHGFDFTSAFPEVPHIHIPLQNNTGDIPMYKSGVLFSALHPKGPILIAFLKEINFVPSKVVFVDDILDNILSVTEAMDNLGIDCVGIHYRGAFSLPSMVKELQGKDQINHFLQHGLWINDTAWNELSGKN